MIIKRKLLDELRRHCAKKEITLIVGPRQAGKTTLMLELKKELENKNERTIFFNLDFEEDRRLFSSQLKVLSKINLELGQKRGYVFIDEIQRKEDAGLFLKGLYDRELPYKFIVSGSGSIELKEKIHESLVGRKQIFELGTLTFEEFVNYKTSYRYEDYLQEFLKVDEEKTMQHLEEYLNFGGYPRVVIENELKDKSQVIADIMTSYIERDISSFLKVEKLESYSHMIRILAGQVGNLINYSELSSTLGLSLPTLKNYLWYAEKTFVVERVPPYYSNIRKEITKSPVYYFNDLGLRNYALGIFGSVRELDFGFLFQNFVYKVLKDIMKYSGAKIYFWRTKDRAEVDFVIQKGNELTPVEAKFMRFKKPELPKAMRNFIRRYAPKRVYIVNLNYDNTLKMGRTFVHYLPFFKLVSLKF